MIQLLLSDKKYSSPGILQPDVLQECDLFHILHRGLENLSVSHGCDFKFGLINENHIKAMKRMRPPFYFNLQDEMRIIWITSKWICCGLSGIILGHFWHHRWLQGIFILSVSFIKKQHCIYNKQYLQDKSCQIIQIPNVMSICKLKTFPGLYE